MFKFLKSLLMIMFVMSLSSAFTSCGGDDDDEPDNPGGESGKVSLTEESLVGTWKGVFKDYTGVRDELITIYFSSGGYVQIWWTHYLNMDQYYLTGNYSVAKNKITITGKYGKHGSTPSQDYDRTVGIDMSKDGKTITFDFDVDTWILTKR